MDEFNTGVPQWKTWRDWYMRPHYGPPHNLSLDGWQMREDQIKAWLGLNPKRHLSPDKVDPQYVGNVLVWVESREETRAKGMFHRVICECPLCGDFVPAGRLYQHQGKASIGRGRRARKCTER